MKPNLTKQLETFNDADIIRVSVGETNVPKQFFFTSCDFEKVVVDTITLEYDYETEVIEIRDNKIPKELAKFLLTHNLAFKNPKYYVTLLLAFDIERIANIKFGARNRIYHNLEPVYKNKQINTDYLVDYKLMLDVTDTLWYIKSGYFLITNKVFDNANTTLDAVNTELAETRIGLSNLLGVKKTDIPHSSFSLAKLIAVDESKIKSTVIKLNEADFTSIESVYSPETIEAALNAVSLIRHLNHSKKQLSDMLAYRKNIIQDYMPIVIDSRMPVGSAEYSSFVRFAASKYTAVNLTLLEEQGNSYYLTLDLGQAILKEILYNRKRVVTDKNTDIIEDYRRALNEKRAKSGKEPLTQRQATKAFYNENVLDDRHIFLSPNSLRAEKTVIEALRTSLYTVLSRLNRESTIALPIQVRYCAVTLKVKEGYNALYIISEILNELKQSERKISIIEDIYLSEDLSKAVAGKEVHRINMDNLDLSVKHPLKVPTQSLKKLAESTHTV